MEHSDHHLEDLQEDEGQEDRISDVGDMHTKDKVDDEELDNETKETESEAINEPFNYAETENEKKLNIKGEEVEEVCESILYSDNVQEIIPDEVAEDLTSDAVDEILHLDTAPSSPSPLLPSWLQVCIIITCITLWISFLIYCYLYLTTVCTTITMWCPDPTLTFTTRACCSSLWLNLGAPVGLGNECTIDMEDMEDGCPMYDCYRNKTNGELNVNGCTGVPNTLFNEAACNIHDLCYITPGATKKDCDDTFVDNIVRVYCDNVNVLERLACTGRAQLAGAVVSAIDSFYDDSAETRATCSRTVKITQPWIVAFILTLVVGALVPFVIKRKGDATVEIGFEETILSEEKVEEIVENNDEIVDEISNEFVIVSNYTICDTIVECGKVVDSKEGPTVMKEEENVIIESSCNELVTDTTNETTKAPSIVNDIDINMLSNNDAKE